MAPEVSRLFESMRSGDRSALSELVTALYGELHRIAARHLRRERPDHTLQATALVHEAYLKLMGDRQREFADRAHFLALASRAMRQVLVDYARARESKKRSGDGIVDPRPEDWTGRMGIQENNALAQVQILDLDFALDGLAREDQALAQLIEMRYFGGMTAEETAEVLGHSVHVVRHDLRLAQAWLRRELLP